MRLLIRIGLIGLMLIACSNNFADDHDEAYELLQSGDVLPLEDILEITRNQVQGRVLKVELEHEDGLIIYEIDVLSKNGIVREITVDAKTGDIVQVGQD